MVKRMYQITCTNHKNMRGCRLSPYLPVVLLLGLTTMLTPIPARSASIELIDFSQTVLHDWQARRFKGETRYRLIQDASESCIRANSDASASGLYRRIHIDLEKTPYMHWRWKIDRPLENAHEREKRGDDFAARIYLIVSGGLFFWNTRAINYVWASHEPVESFWDNPYTSRSIMLAVESGAAHTGQWREYRRNIRQDMKRYFGQDIRHIDAVAIMTDTDNTGLKAGACYGPVRFSDD